ncbi:hypothetical protein L612_007800000030 [Rhodococcus rhodochrous J38]|uniref:hypothetical protein n=1 Tax=Rhodococcus rhodochrous TaxID=1829 RepID=UPI00119CC637|nr:hypothetical protein [Rhodococcus rhodochrous]MCB8914025.1 hypothetical protein [Rhodococcus rhodochrous]TWH37592.1 hypothetical protein L612_007800000030 [Rhodococcus rhodochrous J38]
MSGTAKVKPPKDDAEWARNTQRRIEQIEHPSSTRIGPWVLSTSQESGALTASHVNGGAVVLANEPEGEGDADAVSSGWSHIKVSRQTVQTLPRGGHSAIEWDTLESQTDDWSFSPGSTSFVIPQSGVWIVNYQVYFRAVADTLAEALVVIDGSMRIADRDLNASVEPKLKCFETFNLNEGTELFTTAARAGSGTFTIGPYNATASAAATSLSLTRLPIG